MNGKVKDEISIEYYSMIFNFILNLCERLVKFHFCPHGYRVKIWPVQFSSLNCKSAILSELMINIDSFSECFYLFEGHFPSLSVLSIGVKQIKYTSWSRKNTVNIWF